jgi:transposase-like protein
MSPKRTRRCYTAEFKTEVALAALTECQPLAELAAQYQLAPAQIVAGSCSCASRPPRSLPKRLRPLHRPRTWSRSTPLLADSKWKTRC